MAQVTTASAETTLSFFFSLFIHSISWLLVSTCINVFSGVCVSGRRWGDGRYISRWGSGFSPSCWPAVMLKVRKAGTSIVFLRKIQEVEWFLVSLRAEFLFNLNIVKERGLARNELSFVRLKKISNNICLSFINQQFPHFYTFCYRCLSNVRVSWFSACKIKVNWIL